MIKIAPWIHIAVKAQGKQKKFFTFNFFDANMWDITMGLLRFQTWGATTENVLSL